MTRATQRDGFIAMLLGVGPMMVPFIGPSGARVARKLSSMGPIATLHNIGDSLSACSSLRIENSLAETGLRSRPRDNVSLRGRPSDFKAMGCIVVFSMPLTLILQPLWAFIPGSEARHAPDIQAVGSRFIPAKAGCVFRFFAMATSLFHDSILLQMRLISPLVKD